MEGLFRLVAESFVRHGLEVGPVAGPQPSEPNGRLTETPLPEALPEHNYRKKLEGDPAT